MQAHALCEAIASLVGPVYVADIGAYHGSYAVLLGSLIASNGGKVLAVEPNPESFNILEDNIRRNRLGATVIVEQCAISDVDGCERSLLLQGSQSQILKQEGKSREESAVKLRRLDTLLLEHKFPRLDILIVDVEGAELEVLRSLPWHQAKAPTILCELHCNEWPLFGHSAKEFSQFLESHGLICVDTYLLRHRNFSNKAYLGPCLLLPEK